MNITQQVIILSAELSSNNKEENLRRTRLLGDILKDLKLSHSPSTGVYNGVSENSYVAIVKNQEEINTLKDIAFKNFNQESILHQDANQESYLLFNNGDSKRVGRLEEVNPKEIERLENYTVLNNRVYTTILR